MVKSILYEGAIALGTDIDFGKGLGTSEPWHNYCGSGWRKETVESRGWIHNIAEKTTRKIFCTQSQRIQICIKQHG